MKNMTNSIKGILEKNEGEIYLADEKILFPETFRKYQGLDKEPVQGYIWSIKLAACPDRIEVVDYNGKCLDMNFLDKATAKAVYKVVVKRQKELETMASKPVNSKSEPIFPEAYRKLLADAYKLLNTARREADNAEDYMYRRLNTGYTSMADKSAEQMAKAWRDTRKALRILEMVAGKQLDFSLD